MKYVFLNVHIGFFNLKTGSPHFHGFDLEEAHFFDDKDILSSLIHVSEKLENIITIEFTPEQFEALPFESKLL